MKIAKKRHISKKLVVAVAIAAAMTVGALTWWYLQSRDSTENNIDQAVIDRGEAEEREQGETSDTPFRAEDTGGEDVDASSGGISSDSGVITLYSPGENDVVRDGTVIAGIADVPVVNYEIADSGRGLIAQGQANVVNGRFSVTINNLNPSTNEGSLRVFSVDTSTYREENHVNISIRFE